VDPEGRLRERHREGLRGEMTLADLIFIAIVIMTLTGAFLAVWLKNVLYNALSLIVCLFGIACLFIYLNSEFLAIMEVLYKGFGDSKYRPCPLLRKYVDAGYLGKKVGQGFYNYKQK
jgi:hypothetical protein